MTFRKFHPEKRLLKILGHLFRVKIRKKWAKLPFFRSPRILGEAGKQENFTTNVPKELDLKSSSNRYFPKIDVGCPWGSRTFTLIQYEER